jgi:glycosyltransferase involved in cell wall biosynthesis
MAERSEPLPQVSVITIFKDAAPYLREAIDTVLAQTGASFELLLVDDGSTDGSSELADAAAARDPDFVRVLRHEGRANRGMSASRNLGIAAARAPLVAFLDGDDVWLEGRLAAHVQALERQPEAAMVFGPTRLWFSWADGGRGEQRDPLRTTRAPAGVLLRPPELLVGALRHEVKTPATCSMTLRTAAVRRIGGFEAAFRGMYEDQVFFAKLWLREPCVAVDDCLDLYRQHPKSACYVARYEGRYYGSIANREHRAFVDWLAGHVAEHGNVDPRLQAALDWWLERYRHPWRARIADWWRDPRWQTKATLRALARAVLPDRAYRWVWSRWQGFTRAHHALGE